MRTHPLTGRLGTIETTLTLSFGVVFVILMLVINVYFPNPSPSQYSVFTIILSLASAGIVAGMPGFFSYDLALINKTARLLVRIGGAMIVFIVTLFYSPAAIVATPPRVALLVERHQKEIGPLLTAEAAFWPQSNYGEKVATEQECVRQKKCNSDDLLKMLSNAAKDDPEQNNRVSQISEFYFEVSMSALRGDIAIKDACACFGSEIEKWQRSYYYFLNYLSDINGGPRYQETLHDFSINRCTAEMTMQPCRY